MLRYQDSTAVYIKSSFFWVVTQCWLPAEDGINKLSQNIGKKKTINTHFMTTQNSEDLTQGNFKLHIFSD